MTFPLTLQQYVINGQSFALYEPEKAAVAASYQQGQIAFPYWSQVWPAAISLARFIAQHPEYIARKKVLELAAGLGLPSVIAAQSAASVLASDYAEEAVQCMQQTFAYHRLHNTRVSLLDWNNLPEDLTADVLLLSDVSYDATLFTIQESIIRRFIANSTTVIISTPQRLIAKAAIAPLLSFCIQQEEIMIMHNSKEVATTVMVLKNTNQSTLYPL